MTFEEWCLSKFDGVPFHAGWKDFAEEAWNAAKAEGAREEREACIKACDSNLGTMSMFRNRDDLNIYNEAIRLCMSAIRARGECENEAVSERKTATVRTAPFRDYAGNKLHEGDRIVHPSGEIGTIFFDENKEQMSLNYGWQVQYEDGYSLWLGGQIGDRGKAVICQG